MVGYQLIQVIFARNPYPNRSTGTTNQLHDCNVFGAFFRKRPGTLAYLQRVDLSPTQSAGLEQTLFSADPANAVDEVLPATLLTELWREAEGERVGLSEALFAPALQNIGTKYNYGLAPGRLAGDAEKAAFFRGLKLRDLALAQACALGCEQAWQQFLDQYRAALTQAAISITRSSSLGEDLAGSLYSELFGLTERDGVRRSPLASYSGRGSLMGWLRTTLAQRHVDCHRRTHREIPIEHEDFAAEAPPPSPADATLSQLSAALKITLAALQPEDRFLLSAYFLDGHTLLEMSRLLRVHEATVSRKLKRLTTDLRKQLLRKLESSGMKRRAAEEVLGTDPRDISINLRNLLQTSAVPAFSNQAAQKGEGR